MNGLAQLTNVVFRLHELIRNSVVEACDKQETEGLAQVVDDDEVDTIYAIDRVSEEVITEVLAGYATVEPVCLIAEGIPGGKKILPEGTPERECHWRIIIDPIDGTRGLMYQKRSAWILTGIAPNCGDDTLLSDIVFAIQTEIPLSKQHLSDQVWAYRDGSVEARRFNRLTESYEPLKVGPTRASGLEHGFVTFSRFFPGVRDIIAAIEDEIIREVAGTGKPGKALCFEDQYACTGGQLYELMCGHDRLVADIRPRLEPVYRERDLPPGLCAHPYDICTVLIARSLGVVVTDPDGNDFDARMDVDSNISWVGYANETIRRAVEPHLLAVLRQRGL